MSGRAVFLWVVLPFVALSAVALWLTRDAPVRPEPALASPSPPPPEPAAPPSAPPPPPAPTGERPVFSPPAATATPETEEEAIPEPPPGTWSREEVRVALQSVRRLVRECLDDATLRHVGPQTVRLRFTLESNGGRGHFGGTEVVESTLQDPFVFACLQDAFAEAQFSAPPGRDPLTLSQPFHSRPGKKGVP